MGRTCLQRDDHINTLELDIRRIRPSRAGIQNLVYPTATNEVIAVRDAMLEPLVGMARDEDTGTLKVMLPHLINDLITVYEAHATTRRCRDRGVKISPPIGARVTPALVAGCDPMPPALLARLMSGPSRGAWWVPQVVRQVRWNKLLSGWTVDAFRQYHPDRSTVVVQSVPILVDRVRRHEGHFVHTPYPQWFAPIERLDENVLSERHIEDVVSVAQRAFQAGEEDLSDRLATYVASWVRQASSFIDIHLQRLHDNPELPRQLWTGAAGNPWCRMLRFAVRARGGQVTGHDHGTGSGHHREPNKELGDFEASDEFVTFTESHARALRNQLRPELMVQDSIPEIRGMITTHPTTTDDPYEQAPDRIQSVMYPSSVYMGERRIFIPWLPDVVQLDWELRLFRRLSDWGYRCLHKPHPQSVALPQQIYGLGPRVELFSEPFEEVIHLADVVIFLSTTSTTFRSTLAAGTPIVLIEPGIEELTDGARKMLKERAAFVEAWFDEGNRLHVDWDELKAALNIAPDLTDPSYLETYYGAA